MFRSRKESDSVQLSTKLLDPDEQDAFFSEDEDDEVGKVGSVQSVADADIDIKLRPLYLVTSNVGELSHGTLVRCLGQFGEKARVVVAWSFDTLMEGETLEVDCLLFELRTQEVPHCCGKPAVWFTGVRQLMTYAFYPLTFIADVLLIFEVYFRKEHDIFFVLGLFLLCTPLILFSAVPCLAAIHENVATDRLTKCCLFLPVFNLVAFANTHSTGFQMLSVVLSGVMTYPLFLLNVAFIVQHDNGVGEISTYNWMQMFCAIMVLSLSPFYHLTSLFFKQTNVRKGRHITKWGKARATLCVMLLFGPAVLLEMIHFFPSLFAFKVDKTIGWQKFAAIMICFNAFKGLFVSHMLRKVWDSGLTGIPWLTLSFFTTVVFGVLPLVPYLILMLSKYEGSPFARGIWSPGAKYYWNVLLYLVCAYGGMSLYLVFAIGWSHLSWAVAGAIIIIAMCCFTVLLSLAFSHVFMRILQNIH